MLRKLSFISKRYCSSASLKEIMSEKIEIQREVLKSINKTYGKVKISDVSVSQVLGGLRGVIGLLCDTSLVDPKDGIRFRGLNITECQEKLPRCENELLPESVFWLMLTGDIPTAEQVASLSSELAKRGTLPGHVCKFLDQVPKHVHPMTQMAAAAALLNSESQFVKAYSKGNKLTYWESTFEDGLNLVAKIIGIAAKIYKNTYKSGSGDCVLDESNDWAKNFAYMLGQQDETFVEMMRMYLSIHSDHELGNVSAHTAHLVGSALSDVYLSYSAGMLGLAGPLHGLASEEVVVWLKQLQQELGDEPSEEKVAEFVQKTLQSGKVVPGYGHAVLRETDSRFIVQRKFAEKHFPDDPLCKLVGTVFKVTPPILQKLGKVKSPWPNVDAHSGCLLQHFSMTETAFYTVLFGVSRCLGVVAMAVWDRALLMSIERPKSITTEDLCKKINEANDKKKC